MKTFVRCLILVLSVTLESCDSNLSPSDPLTDHSDFASYDRIMYRGDSLIVSSGIDTTAFPNLSFSWSCDAGTLKNPGNTVTFIAPERRATVTISMTAVSNGSVREQKRFTIFVYQQLVILKADDLLPHATDVLSPEWFRFVRFISYNKLKAGLGIEGYGLYDGNASYYNLLGSLQRSGSFELWNHGYDHALRKDHDEFFNTPYEYQKRHLELTQYLAKNLMGITLTAFGAPGNAFDTTTTKIINEHEDIVVWLNGEKGSKKTLLSPSECAIEQPILYPNFQAFSASYHTNEKYYLFQIHPGYWDDRRFSEFSSIIALLKKNDVTFITPTEFHRWFR